MKPQTIFHHIFEGEVSPCGRATVPAYPGRRGEQRFGESKIATSPLCGGHPRNAPVPHLRQSVLGACSLSGKTVSA
ncbi:MAG: hypothetical protein LBK13_11560, partial [Spirochaetales bacterium]|nr:hypothetical protein [Spirochaetales bacterium]